MRAWCADCHGYREVTDVHSEGHYEFTREVGYSVTEFECGHTSEGPRRDMGPGPGAPDVKPGRLDRSDQPMYWGE